MERPVLLFHLILFEWIADKANEKNSKENNTRFPLVMMFFIISRNLRECRIIVI